MKHIFNRRVLLAAILGLMAGWIWHACSPCITVIESYAFICNHMQLSADDRFLLLLLSERRNPVRESSHVQLWDLHSVNMVHHHVWTEEQLMASGSTLDGALLAWLLLQWGARRRLARVSSPQVLTSLPVSPGRSVCSGNQTPA